jgi:hypothetical protein
MPLVLEDVRRKGPWRQDAKNRLHDGCDLRYRQLDLDARLKENPNNSDPLIALRFCMLDVVDGGSQGSFTNSDDPALHLLRRPAPCSSAR